MQTINAFIPLIISLICLGFIICLIISIAKFVGARSIVDIETKKKEKKAAWKILLSPIVLLIIVIAVWTILNIAVMSLA